LTPDLARQLDTATAFFLAGERCALELKFRRYDFHSIGAPTIVNYSFGVELAMKLIHYIAFGVSTRGHNLERLFEGLPDEIKANLQHLSECVADMARYFEDWRYPFEKPFLLGDDELPRRAFIECYREIRRLRPDLCSVYEIRWGSFEPEWVRTWPKTQPQCELRLAGT
jgi:hypothetical protein